MPLSTTRAKSLIDPRVDNFLKVAVDDILISEFAQSVVIRRATGGTESTLPAQTVFISRFEPTGQVDNSLGADQAVLLVYIIGNTTLDIKAKDRLNDKEGLLYEVMHVRPNRQFQTVAEAFLVQ